MLISTGLSLQYYNTMEATTRTMLHTIPKHLSFELNPTFFVSLLCFIIFIFKLIKPLRTTRNEPNLPPSPPRLPFIGNLHQLSSLPHRSITSLSQKYGPLLLLRLGQTPTLVISSALYAKEIAKSHDIFFSDRPHTAAAKALFYGCTDVGFLPFGEEWRLKRKICVHEFLSPKRVQSFQYIREEEVEDMVNKIRQECAHHKHEDKFLVNMSEIIIAASHNIVTRSLLGHKFEAEDGKGKFEDLARKVMAHLTAFSFGNFFPSLGWMDAVTGLIPKWNATFREVDAFFDDVLAQHKADKRDEEGDDDHKLEKKDFVDTLHQLQKDDLDSELTQSDHKAMILDLFIGGSDTTTAALEWAFVELMRNPRTMRKAQEEVRRVMGNKSKVEENDLRQMKYLECVIKETLRLHPPFALSVPRETISSVTLGEYYVPPKTAVFFNLWGIQRDPEFWERPEEFEPERFENNQIDYKGLDFGFAPFGVGRRGCPGGTFGLASIEYVLANVLYWFDWKLPNESAKSAQDIDMSETFILTVIKKQPIWVQPIPYNSQ